MEVVEPKNIEEISSENFEDLKKENEAEKSQENESDEFHEIQPTEIGSSQISHPKCECPEPLPIYISPHIPDPRESVEASAGFEDGEKEKLEILAQWEGLSFWEATAKILEIEVLFKTPTFFIFIKYLFIYFGLFCFVACRVRILTQSNLLLVWV